MHVLPPTPHFGYHCIRSMCWHCTPSFSNLYCMLQETFERAKAWVKELQRQASPNIVIALAGNKADLAEKRLVEYEVSSAALVLPKNVVLQNLDDTVTFM